MRALFAASLATAFAVTPAVAKSVRVTLTRVDDSVVTSYVVTGDARTLYLNESPAAPVGAPMPRAQIKGIYWEEPDDWKDAWKSWTRRDYAAAGKAFEDLSKTYANLAQIEDSYGSKAKFYQLECLRRTGQYSKLMDVYDEVKAVQLSKDYQKQVQLFNYWGHVGKKLWEPLKLITDKFEMAASEIPAYTVAPTTMPLRGLEPDLLVQIAYLRAISTEMLARGLHKSAVAELDPQRPETGQEVAVAWSKVKAALTDYARVFTLTYMSDGQLSQDAMERSMAILKEDPLIEKDYATQMEAHALAVFYKDLFGKGTVPASYQPFLKVPEPPRSEFDDGAESADKDKDAGAEEPAPADGK
jgi:hypothetical protein